MRSPINLTPTPSADSHPASRQSRDLKGSGSLNGDGDLTVSAESRQPLLPLWEKVGMRGRQ